MSLLAIGALLSVSIGMTGMGSANKFLTMMIGEINRKRAEEEQVSYFGFTPSKYSLIFSEYRRLYPNGKLRLYYNVAWVVGGLGLMSTMVFLIFLGRELPPPGSGSTSTGGGERVLVAWNSSAASGSTTAEVRSCP